MITSSKKLCAYIMHITQKSPKQFRFSFVNRLQSYCLDIVEYLYEANDILVKPGLEEAIRERRHIQRKALSRLKLLCFVAEASMEEGVLTAKQYEQIATQALLCRNLLAGWMISDYKRYSV